MEAFDLFNKILGKLKSWVKPTKSFEIDQEVWVVSDRIPKRVIGRGWVYTIHGAETGAIKYDVCFDTYGLVGVSPERIFASEKAARRACKD